MAVISLALGDREKYGKGMDAGRICGGFSRGV